MSVEETIRDIEKYAEGMEKETSSQRYKPFFTIYAKKRHWANPLRYIWGEFKFKWFEKGRQPREYQNAFDLYAETLDLDIKDIKLVDIESN